MKLLGNIVNYDESFFGEIELKDNIFLSVKKISNSTNEKYDFIFPSFIDSHTHGGYGLDFNLIAKWNQNDFEKYQKNIFSEGVTNVSMTTVTTNEKNLLNIADWYWKNNSDFITAWHIEGPFISKIKKGAHDESGIIFASEELLKQLFLNLANKKIIVTSAIDESNNANLFKKYLSDNFFISLGHSNASNNIVKKYLNENYFDRYTHLFNAMSGFDHRNPGIVFSAFNIDKGWVELIADGFHVNDDVLSFTNKKIGPNRIILVSDSLSLKGEPNSDFLLGDILVEKKDSICYIKNTNTLAGSCFKYIDIVRHFHKVTNCSFQDLVKVSSFNFFKSIHLNNKYGIIKDNMIADFIILDKDLNLKQTYKNGKLVFKN